MKRLLLLLLTAGAPLFAQEAHITVPYTRFSLANGLDVVLHEDHTTPAVSVSCWYHVGSRNEHVGRTGLAHLFEHLMFMGSPNAGEGMFDQWLETAGGDNNASTSTERTNYYEDVPSNAIELPLFLESDRMGYLSQAMTPEKVDLQRSVVKNERRQSMENQPYGMVDSLVCANMYPEGHPFHWAVIGSQQDLTAATFQDVLDFFKKYYAPNNASLVIAGDIDPVKTKAMVEKWFSEIPAGPPLAPLTIPPATLTQEKRLVFEDKVQLPRLYLCWHTPAMFTVGDAELDIAANVLAGGMNSRLYKRLVYELQIAQDVSAFQASADYSSIFYIVATARAGHSLKEIADVIQEEMAKLNAGGPTLREVQRAVNQQKASFYRRLERIGGFGGKADQLNAYLFHTGNPDYFNEDLARYTALDPSDVQTVLTRYLRDDGRFILSVVPAGRTELAVH